MLIRGWLATAVVLLCAAEHAAGFAWSQAAIAASRSVHGRGAFARHPRPQQALIGRAGKRSPAALSALAATAAAQLSTAQGGVWRTL